MQISKQLTFVRAVVTVAALLACAPPALAAQEMTTADEKELSAYRLTMPAMKKWEAVINNMAAWVKSNPEAQAHIRLQSQVDSLRNKDELTESEQARLEKLEQQLAAAEQSADDDEDADMSFDAIAAEMVKFKPMSDALRKAGMNPREYVVFSMALFQASAWAALKKSAAGTQIPADVNQANIRFVEQHAAEIEALQARMQEVGKGFEGVVKKGS